MERLTRRPSSCAQLREAVTGSARGEASVPLDVASGRHGFIHANSQANCSEGSLAQCATLLSERGIKGFPFK